MRSTETTDATSQVYGSTIFFYSNSTFQRVNMKDINYIQAFGDYMKIICEDATHVVHTSMYKIQKMLPSKEFFKAHRSYLVRLDKIDEFNRISLKIKNKRIPISRSVSGELVERLPII